MPKKNKERRGYTKEFKTEAAALSEKWEKPVSQEDKDLAANESVLRRWIKEARESPG